MGKKKKRKSLIVCLELVNLGFSEISSKRVLVAVRIMLPNLGFGVLPEYYGKCMHCNQNHKKLQLK